MKVYLKPIILIMWVVLRAVVTSSGADHLSGSKLGIHLIGRYTPAARKVIAAGPRVIKVFDLDGDMIEAMRDYKSRYPRGKVVLRIYNQLRYDRDSDPVKSAEDYWLRGLKPHIDRLSEEERKLIDYLEGPNECEAYPAWDSTETARWFAAFWAHLARIISRNGFKPCAGSIPVGNPPGTIREMEAKIEAFLPALEEVKRLGGAWSYHSYSLDYTTDLKVERWTSLRYRIFYDYLRRRHPHLADLPLILTEGGIDRRGDPD
ncbi:TPA: hypothetical protein EYP37_06885, partial [Candidatus Poribacteria bacterium]|nr:hypothetical protein [Candidatus Poribacteria bacterium]